jgi:hypothetical protein
MPRTRRLYGEMMVVVEDGIGHAKPMTGRHSSRTRTGALRRLEPGTVVRDEDGFWVVASCRQAGGSLGWPDFDLLLARPGPELLVALEVMEA